MPVEIVGGAEALLAIAAFDITLVGFVVALVVFSIVKVSYRHFV